LPVQETAPYTSSRTTQAGLKVRLYTL
jgi:hypothetical protein